ncbi:MAG: GNAT family N-acetyltransferase [Lutisporaceae bacterium]
MIKFSKMTKEEFGIYRAKLIKSYAATLANNMRRSLEAAMVMSEQQIEGLLKDGVDTKDHYVFNVVDNVSSEKVGILWVNIKPEEKRSFIFDIEIMSEHQGKGYGKATLKELEVFMKEMGIKQIGLNVFADNTMAKALYEKLGYAVTNMNMVKDL